MLVPADGEGHRDLGVERGRPLGREPRSSVETQDVVTGPEVPGQRGDPPVVVLDFPLEEGKEWSTTTTVSGLAQGIGVIYYEEYDDEVDSRGITGISLSVVALSIAVHGATSPLLYLYERRRSRA